MVQAASCGTLLSYIMCRGCIYVLTHSFCTVSPLDSTRLDFFFCACKCAPCDAIVFNVEPCLTIGTAAWLLLNKANNYSEEPPRTAAVTAPWNRVPTSYLALAGRLAHSLCRRTQAQNSARLVCQVHGGRWMERGLTLLVLGNHLPVTGRAPTQGPDRWPRH